MKQPIATSVLSRGQQATRRSALDAAPPTPVVCSPRNLGAEDGVANPRHWPGADNAVAFFSLRRAGRTVILLIRSYLPSVSADLSTGRVAAATSTLLRLRTRYRKAADCPAPAGRQPADRLSLSRSHRGS